MGEVRSDVDCEEIFKKNGYRITLPRRLIVQLLKQVAGHPNAKEIYSRINKRHPEIGLTTVYRTLDLLVQLRIINKFDFGDGLARYELSSQCRQHHHHIICTKCCQIIDYNNSSSDNESYIQKLEDEISQKYKFDIADYEIQFYGICDKCHHMAIDVDNEEESSFSTL